jgi:hypothetical protein
VSLSLRTNRHALRFVACVSLAACGSNTREATTDRAPATLASPKLPSAAATAPARRPLAPGEPAPAPFSNSDLVALFAHKDLNRLSPDEVSGHFARFTTLDRVTFPESLLLEGSMPNQNVTIAYTLAADGSWQFGSAQLVLRPAERDDSDAAYRDAEKQLRKHFGTPKSVRQQGSMPRLIWKRPNHQELWLNQLEPAQAEGTWEITLALGVPDEEQK